MLGWRCCRLFSQLLQRFFGLFVVLLGWPVEGFNRWLRRNWRWRRRWWRRALAAANGAVFGFLIVLIVFISFGFSWLRQLFEFSIEVAAVKKCAL
jgi:hypothetical protein